MTAHVSTESIASPCPIASLFASVPAIGEREQVNETRDPVLDALRLFTDFYEHAHADPRWLGSPNPQLAPPTCECPIVRFPLSRGFQFARYDEPGVVLAVVHVVTASDAETSIGLAAWCPDRPEQIYRYPADLPCLGLDQLDNPTSYFAGRALPVHQGAEFGPIRASSEERRKFIHSMAMLATPVPSKKRKVRFAGDIRHLNRSSTIEGSVALRLPKQIRQPRDVDGDAASSFVSIFACRASLAIWGLTHCNPRMPVSTHRHKAAVLRVCYRQSAGGTAKLRELQPTGGGDVKRILLGSVFVIGRFSAQAADWHPRRRQGPLFPVAVCNWCGFYIGGNAGYTWSNQDAMTVGPTSTTVLQGPEIPGSHKRQP